MTLCCKQPKFIDRGQHYKHMDMKDRYTIWVKDKLKYDHVSFS
jgi:hypothetical protein